MRMPSARSVLKHLFILIAAAIIIGLIAAILSGQIK